ncbi:MAG TPA: TRAP transporter substrate-binding protein [Xanthobacteraceae bacterium]|jgi:TRAP-type C4-dicarboxylate transport system substrate-binding protein|nr:TRAP transporter substrate-binding protein [Xanthobacteraceae bacterium]
MTQIKPHVRLLAGAVAAAVLCFTTPADAQITMKFATLTLNDMQHEYAKLYKDALEKATDGKIKVEVYPAGQLGGAPRQTEGLRLGTIEAAIGPSELFFGADRRFQVLALAGLFKDNEHARKALNVPEMRKLISDFTASRGMITMGLHVYDGQMFAFRAPVTNLAGFAGKRIRVLASEGEQASVSALGAAPVPMSLPEVVPALQQGTIDGVNAPIGVFVPFRYNDAAPNVVDTRFWHLIPIAMVSKVWFDKLPADLQKAVLETGSKLEADIHQWQIKKIADDYKTWADRGGKIVKLSPAEQTEAEKKIDAAIQGVLDKNPPSKEFYQKIKAITSAVK